MKCSALLLLALPALGWAQETAPCDPSKRACLTTEGSLLTVTVTSPGVDPKVVPGHRLQAQIRRSGFTVGGRSDFFGITGQYKAGDWKTANTVEAHVAMAYDWALPDRIRLGAAVAAGAAVPLGAERPTLPSTMTAGIGLRASSPKGWAILIVGKNQQMRGVALTCTWEIPANKALSNVGTFSVGRRLEDGRSVATYIATMGVAATWFGR